MPASFCLRLISTMVPKESKFLRKSVQLVLIIRKALRPCLSLRYKSFVKASLLYRRIGPFCNLNKYDQVEIQLEYIITCILIKLLHISSIYFPILPAVPSELNSMHLSQQGHHSIAFQINFLTSFRNQFRSINNSQIFFLNYHYRVQKLMFGSSFTNPSNQNTAQSAPKTPSFTFGNNFSPNPLIGSAQSPQSNLIDRVAKVEEQYRKLKIEQQNLRNQLEEYKNNPTKQQYDQLKKQLEDLKIRLENSSQNEKLRESTQPRIGLFGQTNVQQKQEEPQKQYKGEKEQLRDSIIELKKIYAKKESELDYAVAIIEKQQKTIEAQTIKISGLEMQIQNGFAKLSLQLSNMNRTLPFPSSINQVGPSSLDLNQSPQMSAPMPFPRIQKSGGSLFSDNQPNFFQQNQLSFQKRSVNPLSQSAVFENKPLNFGQGANNSNSNNNNVTYKQDGYLIKYRCINNMIHNLEISNFLGKIEVLEPIEKKYLANRRISEIVNIGSNVCEIIDHSWDNMYIKLTTFNFMNMQQMSLSERVELNKKVKQQAESTGLEYYLDGLTGNLEITSKPRPTFFKM